MADEKGVAAGKRFARDMRRVREDRDISLATIHEQTQIAETLLESFEKGGLYDHAAFNEVYLRSFVRAYASVVGISPDAAVAGLESALQGTYQNALAVEYLQEAPKSPPEEHRASEGGEEEDDQPSSDRPATDDSEQSSSSSAVDLSDSPSASEPEAEEVDSAEEVDRLEATPPVDAEDAPPQPASLDPHDREPDRQLRDPVLSIGAALLVLAVIGVGLWYALGTGASQSPPSPTATDTTTDTPSAAPTPTSSSEDTVQAQSGTDDEPPTQPVLGDTLHLTLRADSSVTGLRLRRDEDLRRPYWIEEGAAAAFPFTTRAIIENDLDDVTVYLENRRVQLPPDTAQRIVLDRERTAALLENAEEAPAEWSTPPDTIPTGPLAADTSASERR